MAVDAAGDLFIADAGNDRIRKVKRDGDDHHRRRQRNPGLQRRWWTGHRRAALDPEGVAVDAAGDLFIADYYNQRIRKVTAGPEVNPLVMTVNPDATATALTSSANASSYGQSVTFTATVAANPPGSGTPTGIVQFQIDGTNFGSAVTLVNGVATSSAITMLSVTAHAVQAIYSGDVSFMASNGTLTQTVNPAPLTITANNASKTYGQTASFAGTEFTTSGLVNGDTVSSVTVTSTGSAATAAVGPIPSCPARDISAGQSSNYTITYVNGTLTVNTAALSITANNTSKTYGQTASFAGTAFTTSWPGQR